MYIYMQILTTPKRNKMENTAPVVVIGGIQYDATNATPEAQALIQDLSTVQMEMNRIKISYDITGIARQSLLGNISGAIASGESGLVEMEVDEAPAGIAETTVEA